MYDFHIISVIYLSLHGFIVGLLAQLVEHFAGIAEVMCSNPVPEFFSGLISITAQVVFITANIAFAFTSLSAVHLIDFHIFKVISDFSFLESLFLWR